MKKPSTVGGPKPKGGPAAAKKVERVDIERGLVAAIPGYFAVAAKLDEETGKVIGVNEAAIVGWVAEWRVKRDEIQDVTAVFPVATYGPATTGVLHEPDGHYSGPNGERWNSQAEVIEHLQKKEDGDNPA